MKKAVAVSLLVITVLVVSATPSTAWDRGRPRGGWYHGHRAYAGPGWWGPPHWYYYPRTYYIYSPPPTVVVEPPPTYVQQPVVPPPPPPPAPPAPSAQQTYWYYCASAKAYYPTAPACPEPWIRVPPRE